ncbi:MAG: hypothetical protein DME53_14230 [Verrucomicrobia bacterium]|nr:MAG: hypothetical protein DME53_14230 [Verrucomicrobiota bacterium]
MSFRSAKKRFQTKNETYYEKKRTSSCSGRRFIMAQAQAGSGVGCAHGHAFGLHELTDSLNLTPEQQTKVQPILDQTKPQIAAIHQEAMQKMKTVIEGAVSQIRPILTADQQKKLDGVQKAHQDMMNAQKELHDATQE